MPAADVAEIGPRDVQRRPVARARLVGVPVLRADAPHPHLLPGWEHRQFLIADHLAGMHGAGDHEPGSPHIEGSVDGEPELPGRFRGRLLAVGGPKRPRKLRNAQSRFGGGAYDRRILKKRTGDQ